MLLTLGASNITLGASNIIPVLQTYLSQNPQMYQGPSTPYITDGHLSLLHGILKNMGIYGIYTPSIGLIPPIPYYIETLGKFRPLPRDFFYKIPCFPKNSCQLKAEVFPKFWRWDWNSPICFSWLSQMFPSHRIHGTGIFTYMKTIRINVHIPIPWMVWAWFAPTFYS